MNRSHGRRIGGSDIASADTPELADRPGSPIVLRTRTPGRSNPDKDPVTLVTAYMNLLPWPGSKIECTPECAAEETD